MKICDSFKTLISPFFKKVRTACLIASAAGGVLMAPLAVQVDFALLTGSYLLVAGTVLVAVSQLTLPDRRLKHLQK